MGVMSYLHHLGSGDLFRDLLQHHMNMLRASPREDTDDLSSGLLGEDKLPGGDTL